MTELQVISLKLNEAVSLRMKEGCTKGEGDDAQGEACEDTRLEILEARPTLTLALRWLVGVCAPCSGS